MVSTTTTQIGNTQNLNQESYLRGIADKIVSGCGTPVDWGSAGIKPSNLGLASSNSDSFYTIDVDKISLLNSQNQYSLSYIEALTAAKLSNIAFGISLSQMLSIDVMLASNFTINDNTEYTFQVFISQDVGAVKANLHCYVLATDYLIEVTNSTSNVGHSSITFELPSSSSGPAILIVFAQALLDQRLCAYNVIAFDHLSNSSEPNGTYLNLSPINHSLNVTFNNSSALVEKAYALSFSYATNLTSTSSQTYIVPDFVDSSPLVMVLHGYNNTVSFIEWVAYPQIPLTFGGDFTNSPANIFVYTVTIDKVLYRLTFRFGDVAH